MSLPWSEMMNLINLDNELNPTPSAITAQPKKTPSHRYNPCQFVLFSYYLALTIPIQFFWINKTSDTGSKKIQKLVCYFRLISLFQMSLYLFSLVIQYFQIRRPLQSPMGTPPTVISPLSISGLIPSWNPTPMFRIRTFSSPLLARMQPVKRSRWGMHRERLEIFLSISFLSIAMHDHSPNKSIFSGPHPSSSWLQWFVRSHSASSWGSQFVQGKGRETSFLVLASAASRWSFNEGGCSLDGKRKGIHVGIWIIDYFSSFLIIYLIFQTDLIIIRIWISVSWMNFRSLKCGADSRDEQFRYVACLIDNWLIDNCVELQ